MPIEVCVAGVTGWTARAVDSTAAVRGESAPTAPTAIVLRADVRLFVRVRA